MMMEKREKSNRFALLRRMLVVCLVLATLCGTLPVRAAAGKTKLIALTFDDGPCADTNRLLDALKARGVKATFFMVGSSVRSFPKIVKRVYEEGHQVASHTYSHAQLTKLSDAELRSQASRTRQALDAAIGYPNNYVVRPPYGATNQRVQSQLGAPVFLWSVDSNDWRWVNDAAKTTRMILSDAFDGSIVLVHDIHKWSIDGAISAVDTLMANGYEFVTINELFRRRGETLQNGKVYTLKKPSGNDLPAISAPVIDQYATSEKCYLRITADPGAEIYYTTNGTQPTPNSLRYTEPVPLTGSFTITATAVYNWNGSRSVSASATVKPEPKETAPDIAIGEDGKMTVTASAPVFYTTDGSEPTEKSLRYEQPVVLPKGTEVRAFAYTPNGRKPASAIVRRCYSGSGKVYRDVFPSDWYYDSIDFAASAGLLDGTRDGAMTPAGRLTRGAALTAIYRLAGQPEVKAEGAFTDVPASAWYAKPAAWAQKMGIWKGEKDGSFRPNVSVSREQLAELLCCSAEAWLHLSTDTYPLSETFRDRGEVSESATHAMSWAVAKGLLSGVQGNAVLAPKQIATRAQFAAALQQFVRCLKATATPETQKL